MSIALRISLSLLVLQFGIAEAADDAYICAKDPKIVGPCFDVRGRLSFWNGTPSARIWPVHTNRMLGIHHDHLPPALAKLATSFDTEIWANYTLCPFTKSMPGHMQFVCIESWRNVYVRQRPIPTAPPG